MCFHAIFLSIPSLLVLARLNYVWYMTDTCSLVNLTHTYTTSFGAHNLLMWVCIRFDGSYLQYYRWDTMNYIHIPFGGASSSNDALHCMQSNRGWETTIAWSNLSPPSTLSDVQLLCCLLTKILEPKHCLAYMHSLFMTTSNQNLFVTYLPSLITLKNYSRYMSPLS